MTQSLAAKEIQCSDLLRPKRHALFLSLGSDPYRITWLRRVRAGVKWSGLTYGPYPLSPSPLPAFCLWKNFQRSENMQKQRQTIKGDQIIKVWSLSIINQGLNPGLLHCRYILYQLSHKGSPRILEWVAYPFSSRSSWPRNQTGSPALQVGSFPTELWGEDGNHNQGSLIPSQGL